MELGRREVLEEEVREHAGVVHEHVEPAEALYRGADQAVHICLHGDVACGGRDGRPALGEPCACGVEPVGTPVGEHDGGSRLGQTPRAGEAEPLRGARDERHLATQIEQ